MLEKKLKFLNIENCSIIGTILKTHSFRGQVVVKSDFDFISNTEEPIFVDIDNYLVPFFVDNNSIKYLNNDSAIIKFCEIDNEEEVKSLLGKNIFFPTELLHEEKDDGNPFSLFIGFKIINEESCEIGIIDDFIDIPNNPLFQIIYKSKEILIPINGIKIIEKRIDDKTLKINLPEGILDL